MLVISVEKVSNSHSVVNIHAIYIIYAIYMLLLRLTSFIVAM